ncbi:piggyBac transposable element-derived protein 4-like [Penaeus japonicus]|uniref:piggyBac transposable element-derived protein 4-like n=1 Tax=Penaeus japonicus TaxID=27405 RepID=UPI001C714773|nr:piggyBac transposable element-derived protein 4-like [Penaeus japonicus]
MRISVDESLWKFRGRFRAVQYIPVKHAHFGVKVYKLAMSVGPTQGYLCAFRIYVGRDKGALPASMKAVVDLMGASYLFGKGYEVHTDNWYTSPTLFHYLQGRRTNAVGTVWANRKYMLTDLQVKVPGDVDFRSTAMGMLALRWVNKRPVNVLSTVHGSEMVTVTSQSGQQRTKPKVVVNYNSGMKGVDLINQLAQFYSTTRKSMKWYKKVLFYLFDMAVVNAFLLHKALEGRLIQLGFRE